LLQRATERSHRHDRSWFAAQFWLGYLAQVKSDYAAALSHFSAICDAPDPPPHELVDGLAGRSGTWRNLDRLPQAAEDARHALELARQADYPAGEAMALMELSAAAHYADDAEAGLDWARQAQLVDPASIPGWVTRRCAISWALGLTYAGQGASARPVCADMLAMARAAGDVGDQADFHELIVYIAYHTGQLAGAGEHLHEAIGLATQLSNRVRLIDCLDNCGHLCAANGRWVEAVTLWAAYATHNAALGVPEMPQDAQSRKEPLRQAARALGPGRTRAAEQRGAAMTLETAAEFAIMQSTQDSPTASTPAGTGLLSAREQELVTLVAQGHTDAQIAGQLYISIRTVRSHLDRIRGKSGCRRRADLTRLALQEGLV
jgi:DNA-binding CsgD family transcriptional regulator